MNNEVHSNGPQLDDDILADPEVMAAIKDNGTVERRYDINNVQRTLLGRVGGCVAKHHGDFGFSGSLTFNLFVSPWDLLYLRRPFEPCSCPSRQSWLLTEDGCWKRL